MNILPQTKTIQVDEKLIALIRQERVLPLSDFQVRVLAREIEQVKSADYYEYWYLKARFSILVGAYDEFRDAVLNLVRLKPADVETHLLYFPQLLTMGYVAEAKQLLSHKVCTEPRCSPDRVVACLYFLLDSEGMRLLRALVDKVGLSLSKDSVMAEENILKIHSRMPDAPALAESVFQLVSRVTKDRGVVFSYQPVYRYDLEEDCLYVLFPSRLPQDELMQMEDAFWETASQEGRFMDGRVHVVFSHTDINGA